MPDAETLALMYGTDYERFLSEEESMSGMASDGANVLIVTDPAKLSSECKADILHLGDVIEHLTDPDAQIPQILSLLKKGGIFLAQGPLEANPNLFLTAMRWARLLRGRRTLEMPPYQVIQATADGQRSLFRRFGLAELAFTVH